MIAVTLVVLVFLYVFFRYTPLGLADARRRRQPAIGPARRHPGRLDARARLGPGGGDRRDRRHDDRADRVPRTQHDGRHPALRLRRGAARRHRRAPAARSSAASRSASSRTSSATYVPYVGSELKLPIALVIIVDGAGGAPRRPVRPRPRAAGLTMEAAETLAVARARPALTLGRAILLVGILLAIAVPFAAKSFRVFQLTLVLVYAIALLGLNMLTGYNGQFSLGHGAFYAIGAYTAAILMDKAASPTGWTIPVAGAGLLRRRLPVRPAGAAARGPLSRARDLRARRRDAADPQVLAARALDRRRAGHRHPEARRALRAAAEPGPVALLLHPRRSRSRCSSRALEPPARAASGAPSWRSATTRSRRRRWASTPRSTSR